MQKPYLQLLTDWPTTQHKYNLIAIPRRDAMSMQYFIPIKLKA